MDEPIQPQPQSVHLLDTCRMGNDPRTSVIDRYCVRGPAASGRGRIPEIPLTTGR